ncbi:UDP-forming cellulose synthase catalytic subunit [Rahnella sp. SL6]|uniref:UDP-forming cellulose synthase catalytic subunit n=1 Tax=Rahnella perminowiae TaxID=2816244 RepID=UPI001C252CD1|nr:UDP-forming cellulose synthase catalytic subunit [Rahnella perminowiae]MBU9812231.1 UDP-forming cellulose synthase catalytic subunit [Rahnella perminowiae]
MNRLLNLFLVPPVVLELQNRYRHYRASHSSRMAAGLMIICVALCWLFLRFESPFWQRVNAQRTRWYPQISPSQPRLADPLRYIVQSVWLLIILPSEGRRGRVIYSRWPQQLRGKVHLWLRSLPGQVTQNPLETQVTRRIGKMNRLTKRILVLLTALLTITLAMFCISQPFGYIAQFVFVVLLWSIAMIIRRIPGRFPALMMIVLSLTISCRYLWWRYTSTLNWEDPLSLICGLLLLGAETYSWTVLVLGYIQTIWPLNRKPVPMPADISTWPTVDLLIPTYNEDLSVVKPTLYAALGLDWPRDKLTIYLLDDGNRQAFADFAHEIGVKYIARETRENAKAGNINHALKQAKSQLVAIFDCDHVPTRSFLQLTVGWFFKDKKLSMLQTPHHFFSPDPFERNLGRMRRTPNEGELFYGLVQDGNDLWDASFFCGSCAVLRRDALDEIGGIAIETVTEDAHTSLRMHRHGYTSAYIRIPQAAGLATESLSAHISQRIRWARGMVQIFRLDNPLFGKGLKLAQRLCYANAMLHFLAGIPRLIFLTAPLAFLLLHAYIIYAPAVAIALYVLPHMIHASLTNSRVQGKYRHSFWNEIYETVLAWYIARPTTVALFNPHAGTFNVTAKGGLNKHAYVDWKISRPYQILMLLNLAGLFFGIYRIVYGRPDEILTVLVSMAWVIYNMIILGGAIAVAFESKQVRQAHRVEARMPASLLKPDGHIYVCTIQDYSDSGVGLETASASQFQFGDNVTLILSRGQQEYTFPMQISRVFGENIGMQLLPLTTQQHIDFIQCTFARADSWVLREDSFPEDKPMESLREVLGLGIRGYLRMLDIAPQRYRPLVSRTRSFGRWLLSFAPRNPSLAVQPVESNLMMTKQ